MWWWDKKSENKIEEPKVGHLDFGLIKVQQCSLSVDFSFLTTLL